MFRRVATRVLRRTTAPICSVVPKHGWIFLPPLPPATKVVPGLYIGNFRDSKDPEQLQENNITHILAIHDNARKIHQDKEYLCIRASDSPGQNLIQFFSACNDFIHSARLNGGNVLIHCLAGVSRSVTIAVAYLMSVTALHWRDALNAVRGARSVANPNFGFQRQLQNFEMERLKDERRRLREKYPPNPFPDEQECRKLVVAHRNASHATNNNVCEAAPRPPFSSHALRLSQRQRSISKERLSRPQSPARSQYRSPSKERTENYRPP